MNPLLKNLQIHLYFCDLIPFNVEISLVSFCSIVNILVLLYFRTFEKFDISITKPFLFAPEQFESCFKEIVEACFSNGPLINKLKFLNCEKSRYRGLKKLVIVFDNIDRCHHDLAYSLLTDIKTFLSPINKNVIFVIPVDDSALKKNFKSDSCSVDYEKEEFLRKFFNTVIRIKPYAEMDMFEFAKNVAEEHCLTYVPDTLYFVSRAYSKNPRRIIQLYNNLETENLNYTESFVQQFESQICALLILREDYPDCYKEILNNPQILRDEKNRNSEPAQNNSFLRIITPSFKSISIDNLSRILTNTESYFASLNSELKDALDDYDDEYLKKNNGLIVEKRIQVIDYLFHHLEKSVRNGVSYAVISLFGFCSRNYKLLGLGKEWRRFDALYENFGYDEIFKNLTKERAICEFVDFLTLNTPSYPETQEKFVDYLVASKDLNPEFGDEQYILCSTNRMLERLSEKFVTQYDKFEHWDDLQQIHLTVLITNDTLSLMINDISSLSVNSLQMSRCLTVMSKKTDVSEQCYRLFIDRLLDLFSAKKSFENHFLLIKNILVVIKNKKKDEIFKSEPLQIGAQLIDQTFFQRNGPNLKDVLLKFWKNEDCLADLFEFLYERIRLFEKTDELQRIIKDLLMEGYQSNMVSLYNRLILEKNDVAASMADIVDSLQDFSSSEQLNILAYAALYRNTTNSSLSDGSNYIFSAAVNNKIPDLFNYLDSDGVIDVISNIGNIPIYAETVKKQFSEKDDVKITGKLIPLALSDFTKEHLDRYKGNYAFLQFVLQNGSDVQKNLVRDILIENIHSGKFLEKTFDTIDSAWSYISANFKDEFIAATKTLQLQVENEDLERVKAFIEKFKN